MILNRGFLETAKSSVILMPKRTARNHSRMKILGILLIAAGLIAYAPMQVAAQDDLTLSLTRNIGIGLGGIIQGTFTLHGSGPEEVQNITVYFNGEQVHFANGNTLAWQFNTDDYPAGSTNITLLGVDNTGETYVASTSVMFLSAAMGTAIFGIVIVVVAVLIIVKYGPMLRKKKRSSSS